MCDVKDPVAVPHYGPHRPMVVHSDRCGLHVTAISHSRSQGYVTAMGHSHESRERVTRDCQPL